MFKKTVSYKNFAGDETNETFCFNITIPEAAKLEFEFAEGFEAYVREAVKTGNNKNLYLMFELMMAVAYGRFSPDGKTFVKKREWLDELFCNLGYEALFIWLFTKEENAVTFYKAVMPQDVESKIPNKKPAEAVDGEKPKRVQDMSHAELVAALQKKTAANETSE